ncbi:unnamed protein product [Mytilus coruscus]|uniref:Reverse transcriptase domain-containing protein n=1 Tax=Mytilus coruscus TaxID=42192 RepID=A0A6J8AUP6_MYTCO|nr:unnamed protein product [Mytilus coruscus]
MVSDIEGAEAIIDDILIWGSDQKEHDMRLKQVLDRAREYNLKLSAGKCKISKPEVTYVGHRLTREGVKPDPEKIRAVNKMPKPECVKDLQTFMGFIQYLGKYVNSQCTVKNTPRKKTVWHWDEIQETGFQKLKEMAINAPLLQYYDPNKPLTLSVDASLKGLGVVLIQNQKPVAYASRALTHTQQLYPQIEKETFAIVYGCNKFHEYGKEMYLADHLSRSFLKETKEVLVPDLHVTDIHLISHMPIAPERYAKFQKETANDEHLQELQDVIFDGWPNEKSELLHSLRPYWTLRDEL